MREIKFRAWDEEKMRGPMVEELELINRITILQMLENDLKVIDHRESIELSEGKEQP